MHPTEVNREFRSISLYMYRVSQKYNNHVPGFYTAYYEEVTKMCCLK